MVSIMRCCKGRNSDRYDNLEIGDPKNINHDIHVIRNQQTGQLEGLPHTWVQQMNMQFSEEERLRNPTAIMDAIVFYNYQLKKGRSREFKLRTSEFVDDERQDMQRFARLNAFTSSSATSVQPD